jgi:hypothetical protein
MLGVVKTISSTKKSTTFFHAQISRSGKKYIFFGEDGIFFAKLAFSAVICGI